MSSTQNVAGDKRLSAVFKILEYEGGYGYDNDTVENFATAEFERWMRDDRVHKMCVLQPEDTRAVFDDGKSISVIEPQHYSRVTTLDQSHWIFGEEHSDPGCRGMFYEYEGDAVTGSGEDRWYKLCEDLVEFCATLDRQASALKQYLEKTDHADLSEDWEGTSFDPPREIMDKIRRTDKKVHLLKEDVERQERILEVLNDAVAKHEEEKAKNVAALAKELAPRKPSATARKASAVKKQRTGGKG